MVIQRGGVGRQPRGEADGAAVRFAERAGEVGRVGGALQPARDDDTVVFVDRDQPAVEGAVNRALRQMPLVGSARRATDALQGMIWLATSSSGTARPVTAQRAP